MARRPDHRQTYGARGDGAVGHPGTAHQRIRQRHEETARKLERAHLAAPAQKQGRLQDVERLELQRQQPLFHLTLGAQIEVACRGVGSHAGDDHAAPCVRRLRGAREREHTVHVHGAECLLRARLAQRRSEAAKCDVAAHTLQLRLEMLELHDAVGEARMLPHERAARDRHHARHFRGVEQGIERPAPGQAASAGQQRDPAARVNHAHTAGSPL